MFILVFVKVIDYYGIEDLSKFATGNTDTD